MKFVKIFEKNLDNFFLSNKIKKIWDFDVLFKLIDIKKLASKNKNENLKNFIIKHYSGILKQLIFFPI